MPARPPRPVSPPVNADAVPELLRARDRWVNWSWSWDGSKWDKPPRRLDGTMADSTDPSTWTSFEKALEACRQGRFDGLGFTLGRDEETGTVYSGLDLDHCVHEGQVDGPANYLAGILDSYTEISPSLRGIKVFATGPYPRGRRTVKQGGVELYDSGRYFTVTGLHLPAFPCCVMERTKQLATLHAHLFPPALPSNGNGNGKRLTDREVATRALAALSPARAADYHSWLYTGMALHSVSDDLLPEWEAWSKSCPEKYAEGCCEKKWASFRKSGLSLGSLIEWARQDGWVWPPVPQAPPVVQLNGRPTQRNDDHMGNGLTEEDGAGPWHLIIEAGNPKRYLLRSPIWADSPHLTDGYLVLSKEQLVAWRLIRNESIDQAGVYARPDRRRAPVWDGARGPRLLRRLLATAKTVTPSTDFDRVLTAAEYILDCARKAPLIEESLRDQTQPRDVLRLEDGTVLFRLAKVASRAKKELPSISFEDIREAATRYGREQCPRIGGKRSRYFAFGNLQVEKIENEISQRIKPESE